MVEMKIKEKNKEQTEIWIIKFEKRRNIMFFIALRQVKYAGFYILILLTTTLRRKTLLDYVTVA